jgi:coenzyme F420-reducing hydrogenase beta subunit
MASAAENPAPIISSKHRRCAGCGKFMQKDEAHILVGSDYSHMTEQCMDKVATKIREEKPDWDWTPGNKEIRK